MGSHPNMKSGKKNQSFMYVIVDEKPYWYALVEYLTKLWEPIPVATIEIVMSHQEKRRPPKK
jgi:hypothetical protein